MTENYSNTEIHREHVVVTVHGIRTYGSWQKRLKEILVRADPGLESLAYVYGYFSMLAFILPPFRWIVTARFRRALLELVEKHPQARIDIVAHSFGTHLVGWGLRGIPQEKRPCLHTVILAGSVLKRDFPWSELIAAGTIKRVINECGIEDSILLLNQLCVLFTGMAGRTGFIGMTGEMFKNRFFRGGHSHYFVTKSEEEIDFMEKYWLPALVASNPVPDIDERHAPGVLKGLIDTIAQNAEPIKLTIYAAILLLPGFLFFMLYQDAELQRMEAKKQRDVAVEQTQHAQKASLNLIETVEWLFNETLPVRFDLDSSSVKGFGKREQLIVRELTTRLKNANVSEKILIRGHTGDSTDSNYGLILADELARSMRVKLVEADLPSGFEVSITSCGKAFPLYTKAVKVPTERWELDNRFTHRVVLKIVPAPSLASSRDGVIGSGCHRELFITDQNE